MARKSARAALELTPEQKAMLKDLAGSRTAASREVERAKVLLGYAGGMTVTEASAATRRESADDL